jgi:hypothetical protein
LRRFRNQDKAMNRRQVAAFLGYLSFAGVAALCRAVKAFAQAPDAPEHVERTIAAVAEVMLPGDGLPGAAELGLHRGVLANADRASLIAKGVSFLDQIARRLGASDFVALDEPRRLAALDAAFASGEGGVQPFVFALRHDLMTAYYSAAAIKSDFAYTGPLQPDGFADFQDRPA